MYLFIDGHAKYYQQGGNGQVLIHGPSGTQDTNGDYTKILVMFKWPSNAEFGRGYFPYFFKFIFIIVKAVARRTLLSFLVDIRIRFISDVRNWLLDFL